MNAFFRLANKRVAVTGATGFVGECLVDLLLRQNCHVVAIGSSEGLALQSKPVEYVQCDLAANLESITNAVSECEIVFHLAAQTRSIRAASLLETNPAITENVLKACAASKHPLTVILVSSLAAMGPGDGLKLLREDQGKNPLSFYGKSKSMCEDLAYSFADQFPISIVRPPIVLGPGDKNGFSLFESIDRWRQHFIPGLKTKYYSIIHVEDLATALIGVAEDGRRIDSSDSSQGIYFVSADEIVTYAELGQLIADALGTPKFNHRRIPDFIIRLLGITNEVIARIFSRSQYLNRDKFRDVLGGSWACSNDKIKQEIGFTPIKPLAQRLQETACWYRDHGWLKSGNLKSNLQMQSRLNIDTQTPLNQPSHSTTPQNDKISD